jgi:hypothetical protein
MFKRSNFETKLISLENKLDILISKSNNDNDNDNDNDNGNGNGNSDSNGNGNGDLENKLDILISKSKNNDDHNLENKLDILISKSNNNFSYINNIVLNLKRVEEKIDHNNENNHKNENNETLKLFIKEHDQKLRSDLHSFILGIKQEICKDISEIKSHYLKDVKDTLTLISNNVDGFFFDNETIKHQLQIEEDIRKYMDDIDAIKLTIEDLNNDINNIKIKLNI